MELDRPEPGPGEILVKLVAAGMNPFDWKVADGMLQGVVEARFPLILGQDGAGVVEAVGEGADRFRVGDQVYGSFGGIPRGLGSYAEFAVVPQDGPVATMPQKMVYSQAAAVPTASMTAYNLVEKTGVEDGRTVLVIGASGGVGQAVVQLAALKGGYVIATASPDMTETMLHLGADETVDYRAGDLFETVSEAHPDGVDVLIDLVDGERELDMLAGTVKKGGVVASTVGQANTAGLKKRGIKAYNFQNKASGELLAVLAELIDGGKLTVHVSREVDLAETPAAIAEAKRGGARGKTVIRL
ncbi:NADP-dependent oxidoreductase [Actinomadura harenae]|uniref:NADP-dependent oxidoreductase n=2 Tax=Actinomadura harenae TaxID=2483351 RepID=A0A3M2LV16_9ACTN|nr:NADP-dependent oxidoreductase [Actinomadura harenae]